MDNVKRYGVKASGVYDRPDGIWCRYSDYTALRARLEAESKAMEQLINERDHAQDMADKLARAIGGEEVGEHSNMNCPWHNSLEIATNRADEIKSISDLLDAGQGDDDGSQILPDFTEGMSVVAKVEACLHFLERRRDTIDGFRARLEAVEKERDENAKRIDKEILYGFEQKARAESAEAALEAMRKEQKADHANINLKADFIEKTLDQLAGAEAALATARRDALEEAAKYHDAQKACEMSEAKRYRVNYEAGEDDGSYGQCLAAALQHGDSAAAIRALANEAET